MQLPETQRPQYDTAMRAPQPEWACPKTDELECLSTRALRVPGTEAEEFYADPPCTD